MKICTVSLFLALLVAVCLPAVAQTKMGLDIPFNFTVAGKSLPAGHYTVGPAFGSDSTAWSICNDLKACAIVLTHAEASPLTPHRRTMVFLLTSEGYALVQFWPTGSLGRDLVAPKVEHTLMAGGDKKYVEVSSK
ncbi:MAG: hypothetical protein ABSF85_06305 [Terriglobales bacterium]|jgi:hypothetical protein